MDTAMDRRSFLTGAVAATGLAAATALTGCAPNGPSNSTSKDAEAPANALASTASPMTAETADDVVWSFEVPPEPVAEDKITQTYEADIVVIGAGVSGLVCAAAAAEAGADVILFAASSTPVSRGGSNHGIGTKTQKALGIDYTPENSSYLIKKEFAYDSCRPDMAKWYRWINHSPESMDWLIDIMEAKGYKTVIEVAYQDPDNAYTEMPGSHGWIGGDVEGDKAAHVGETLVTATLEEKILGHGSQIHYKTTAQYLEKDGDRVVSVIATDPEGNYVRYVGKNGIVMATGDFSLNKDMMRKYCPEYAHLIVNEDVNYDATFQTGGMFPGDGQKMGLWAGAAWQKTYPNAPMINCNSAQPHSQSMSSHEGICMNKAGKRFFNEGTNCAFSAYQYLLQPEMTWYAVWDTPYAEFYPYWEGVGCSVGSEEGRMTPAQQLEQWEAMVEAGAVVKADTLEEVLGMLDGLDVEQALKTVERYNSFVDKGVDEDYHKNKAHLAPIKTGPFYACKNTMNGAMNFLCVMGGLRTSKYMEVCDANDEPIPGLYNLGVMVGDTYSGIYTFSIPGHNLGMNCITFGYLLGRQLATGEVVD